MPLVYINPAEMSSNPMLDIPYAVFFWSTTEELSASLRRDVQSERLLSGSTGTMAGGNRGQAWVDERSPNEHLYGSLVTERTL